MQTIVCVTWAIVWVYYSFVCGSACVDCECQCRIPSQNGENVLYHEDEANGLATNEMHWLIYAFKLAHIGWDVNGVRVPLSAHTRSMFCRVCMCVQCAE